MTQDIVAELELLADALTRLSKLGITMEAFFLAKGLSHAARLGWMLMVRYSPVFETSRGIRITLFWKSIRSHASSPIFATLPSSPPGA